MLSTALKPIEQTMSMPPTWLPYRYYCFLNKKIVYLIPKQKIEMPSIVLKSKADNNIIIIPKNELDQQKIELDKFELISEVTATKSNPYIAVTPENEKEIQATIHFIELKNLKRKIYPRWENFRGAIKAMKYFWLYLKNTLILCFLNVLGTVISSAFAAYGFSRIDWKGRDKIFLLALATMMVPFPVIMVPLYSLYRKMQLIGTPHPLWIGSFFAGAFNVFLLRQFFLTIPNSISEAARIDGCSEFQIFTNIILPMSKPALLVVALFQFMGTWNDFIGPLLFLTNQEDFTLALGLQFFQSQHGGTEWNYLMAASLIVVAPVIVLFLFTQKAFIEGIATSGIKG